MNSPDLDRALRESAVFVRREDRGHLRLGGADRLTYLQGLLTNDVASLAPGDSRYAALLTAQGRMIADMNVHALGDAVLIELDRTLAPGIREHLDRFVITEDVTVEDLQDQLTQVGVYGRLAPALVHHVSERALANWPSTDTGLEGVELVVPADHAETVEQRLREQGSVAGDAGWLETARVEAGMPKFLVDMDTTTIPLEAGIEERAISLTKGCYVGQEVIIRVLHRGGGRVAKKLVGLRAGGPVRRDDRLWIGDKEVGRITSAVESPRLGPIALGYVQRDFVEPGTQLTARGDGTDVTVTVTPVPFTRPT